MRLLERLRRETEPTLPPEHTHVWTDTRVIRRDCTCGAHEYVANHRGSLKGQKVPNGGRKRKLVTPEVDARIADLYARGWTQVAIAKDVGFSQTTVRDRLSLMGLPQKTGRRLARGTSRASVLAMLLVPPAERPTFVEVAAAHGITRERARQIAHKEGFDPTELTREREQAHREAKAAAKAAKRSICRFCGADFTGTTWPQHLHIAKHPPVSNEVNARWMAKEAAIAADYAAGMKTADIEAKHHTNPTAIRRARERRGLPMRISGNWTKTRAEAAVRKLAIAADLRAGMERDAIAKKFNVSTAWVSVIATERGLATRRVRRYGPEIAADWRARYEAGATTRSIADEDGVARGTVYSVLLRAGTVFRPKGYPPHER